MADSDQQYEANPNRRTAEQNVLFELARSQALRESSHTDTEQAPSKTQPMVPNPAYSGMSGIFNMIGDALSGKYQAQVKK